MKKILVFAHYFYPAYKAGGPVKSLVNLFSALHEKMDFYLLTGDRDLGDDQPFANTSFNCWLERKGIHVKYLSGFWHYLREVVREIRSDQYDVIYFNSFFSLSYTVVPLIFIKILNIKRKVVVSPRGELGCGALCLKKEKKQLFIKIARVIGLYKNVIWQATSDQEVHEVKAIFGDEIKCELVPNIIGSSSHVGLSESARPRDIIRMVFLSRVSRKKNLLTLIQALKNVDLNIVLDVYGPLEDWEYYQLCLAEIAKNNEARVNFKGAIKPENVIEVLSGYHMFVLPTLNENFGHVILEALEAGCYVVTTTGTPWAHLEEINIGKILDPYDVQGFALAIRHYAEISGDQRLALFAKTRQYFDDFLASQDAILLSERMFGACRV